jgi:hypothetical protein
MTHLNRYARRGFIAAGLACALAAPAWAQERAAARPVEVIMPYAAGGGVDAMGRAFAREASRLTGDAWVVVNKDGAAGMLGFAALASAAPDGRTVVFSPASPLVITPFVTKTMPFAVEKIEPVCQVFENVFAIAVRADSPIKSLPDLIAQAKAAPGKLSYGHAGTGSVPHLSTASLEKALGVRFNPIPYRGDGPMLPQLMGGQLDFGVPEFTMAAAFAYSLFTMATVAFAFAWHAFFKNSNNSKNGFMAALMFIALLCGMIFPLDVLPGAMQYVGAVFPAYWMTRTISQLLEIGMSVEFWLFQGIQVLFIVGFLLYGGKQRIS